MEVLLTPADMQRWAGAAAGRIALVVTMGNLHEGHASLVRHARTVADHVVVSAFVNPLGYGPGENPALHPATPDEDARLAAAAGADVLFTPAADLVHPPGAQTLVDEGRAGRVLCGISRPVHFRGFLTCFLKLAFLAQPTVTLFGQRDVQQAVVVRRAARDLFLPLEVLVRPTVREADGLPVSWRNSLLTPTQRREAAALPAALQAGAALAARGVRSVDRIIAETTHGLRSQRALRVIYVHLCDPGTLEPCDTVVPGASILAAAVWVEETRLIDNVLL